MGDLSVRRWAGAFGVGSFVSMLRNRQSTVVTAEHGDRAWHPASGILEGATARRTRKRRNCSKVSPASPELKSKNLGSEVFRVAQDRQSRDTTRKPILCQRLRSPQQRHYHRVGDADESSDARVINRRSFLQIACCRK